MSAKMLMMFKKNIRRTFYDILVFGIFILLFYISLVYRRNKIPALKVFKHKSSDVKYVLISTSPAVASMYYTEEGNQTFCTRNCLHQNCYLTLNRRLIMNITEYDAVIFHAPNMPEQSPEYYLPAKRPEDQIYIFASRESAKTYDVIEPKYNGMFNFTWTHKLTSDISFGYMVVKDQEYRDIGPNLNVPWLSINDMDPIDDTIKEKLTNKRIAAAWFVTNCDSLSGNEKIAEIVVQELAKYNMTVDIYGECADIVDDTKEDNNKTVCPLDNMDECLEKLQTDYYFYFAFENSLGVDYVTDQLLIALQNYAVPVVYGGADYKRFMPPGIYLDVTSMSVPDVVNEMVRSIKDKRRYYDFFRWHNHYSYHRPEEDPDTDPFCSLCSLLNNVNYTTHTAVDDFYNWWNDPDIFF